MEFRRNNDAFLLWFLDTVALFHELTANMTDDERRRLTTDPGSLMYDQNLFIICANASIFIPENLLKHQIV